MIPLRDFVTTCLTLFVNIELRKYVFLSLLLGAFSLHAKVPDHLWVKGAPPVELPEVAAEFVNFETQGNPAVIRSNKPFWIEHLEIPLAAIDEDRAAELDMRIRDSLVFEREGVRYVRWPLNPEDTQWGVELQESLKNEGIVVQKSRYFIGYLTASRSCIIQDPKSKIVFSIKASTNNTGGPWKDKGLSVLAAGAARRISDYFRNNFRFSENKTFRVVPEPLAFSFGPANQSIVIRQYDHFNDVKPRIRLIPAFTIVHEKEGPRLAKLNGSEDPNKFWIENLVEPLAEATVERTLNFGVVTNSGHEQNNLVETDMNYKPTGRIHFRDPADAYLIRPIVESRNGGDKLLNFYGKLSVNNEILSDNFNIYVDTNRGTQGERASWQGQAKAWYDVFENVLQKKMEYFWPRNNFYIHRSADFSEYESFSVSIDNRLKLLNYFDRLRTSSSLPPENLRKDLDDQLLKSNSASEFLSKIDQSIDLLGTDIQNILRTKVVFFERMNPTKEQYLKFLEHYQNPLLRRKWKQAGFFMSIHRAVPSCLKFYSP